MTENEFKNIVLEEFKIELTLLLNLFISCISINLARVKES